MKRRLFLLAVAVASVLGCASSSSLNAQPVSGVLTRDEIWSGVVDLGGDVIVPAGITLTLLPGTSVRGHSYWDSVVVAGGRLEATGSAAAPIEFRSASGAGSGGWGGIVFEAASFGALRHVILRQGGGETPGMVATSATAEVVIADCGFEDSQEDGINVQSMADPTKVRVSRCTFTRMAGAGVRCIEASPTILACTFTDVDSAVRLDGTSYPQFNGDLSATSSGVWITGGLLSRAGSIQFAGIPYLLGGDLVIPEGIRVDVDPGVVIKTTSYWNSILVDGELNLNGTASNPVILTSIYDDTAAGDTNGDGASTEPRGSQWGGVVYRSSAQGRLVHCDFRFGGGETAGMLEATGQAKLEVRNCVFLKSGEDGVRLRDFKDPLQVLIDSCRFESNADDGMQCDDASPHAANCVFNDNLGAIYLTGTSFPEFDGDLQAPDGGIWLGGGVLTRSGTFEYAGIPYILNGDLQVQSGMQLGIEPGVIMKNTSYWNSISVDGEFVAEGRADRPIVFTSVRDDTVGGDSNRDGAATEPSGNTWGGIEFRVGSRGSLRHVELRYGGGETSGMIGITTPAGIVIADCSLRQSGEDAIRVVDVTDPGTVIVERCAFLYNAGDAIQCDSASPTILSSSLPSSSIYLTGTSFPHFAGDLVAPKGGVWLSGGVLTRSGVWEDPGIPYVLGGDIVVPVGSTLSLAAGTIFKGNSYWNSLFVEGRLNAVGNLSRPIRFTTFTDDVGGDTNGDAESPTPASPKPGEWGGLVFRPGATGTLNYVDLRYGGGETAAMVEVASALVEVAHCGFLFSAEDGLRIEQFDIAGTPSPVHQCSFAGNARYGVANASARVLDASLNWWAHPTGPYHAVSNPEGQGEAVTDQVLFEPFLTRSPLDPPPTDSNWTARTVVLRDAAEAELLVRTGDIDNLGFGWPPGFDPFSGRSTPVHAYPWTPDPLDPEGTDRIMVVSSFNGHPPSGSDGYTTSTTRPINQVKPVQLDFDLGSTVIQGVVLQVFMDDVQPLGYRSHYNVRLDDASQPAIASAVNLLNQEGPIGKLMNFLLPAESFDLLKDGHVAFLMDDLTTGAGDGFAIDFVRLLINPKTDRFLGKVAGRVTDAETGLGLPGATVSCGGFATTTSAVDGTYQLEKLPFGLAVVQVAIAGYAPASRVVDVVDNQTTPLDLQLTRKSPARITTIALDGPHVRITWEGGLPVFLLQASPSLENPAWTTLVETSDRSVLVPVGPGKLFMRVVQP